MGKRVLVCDDEEHVRQEIMNILRNYGFVIAGQAEDAAETIEKYFKVKPDLVTLDIMPGMGGAIALKEILKADPDAKIIIVSSVPLGQTAFITEAMDAGAKGFLVKPIHEHSLIGIIRRVLS